MTVPLVTDIGAYPSFQNSPDTFPSDVGIFIGGQPTFVTEFRQVKTDYEADVADAEAANVSMTAKANYQGVWNAATTYALGDSVLYLGSYYISRIGSNLNNTPSGTDANWIVLPQPGTTNAPKVIAAATGTVTLELDLYKYFEITVTGNITIALSGAELTGYRRNFTVKFIDGDLHTITYPASFKNTTALTGNDVIEFIQHSNTEYIALHQREII